MKHISLKIKNRFLNDATVQIAPTGKITLPNGKSSYSTISEPTPVLFSMDFKSNKCNKTLMSHLYGLFREPFIGIDTEKAKTLLTWFDELADKNKLGEYNSLNKDVIISKRNKANEAELKEFVQNLADYLARKTGNDSIVDLNKEANPDIDAGRNLQYEFVQITDPEMSVLNGKGMGNCIFGNTPTTAPRTGANSTFAAQVADAKEWLESSMNYNIIDYDAHGYEKKYHCRVLTNPYPFFIVRDKYNSTKTQDHRRYVLVYADKDHWCIWNDEDDKIIECHIAQSDHRNPNAPRDDDGNVIPSIHVSTSNAIVAERCLMRIVTGAAELKDKTGIDIEQLYEDYKVRRANNQVLSEDDMTSYGEERGLIGARNELQSGNSRELQVRNQNERDRQQEIINATRLNRYTTTITYYIVDDFNKAENSALSLRINIDVNYLMYKYLSKNFANFLPNDNVDLETASVKIPEITEDDINLYKQVKSGDIEGLTDEQMDKVESIERMIRLANSKITVERKDLTKFADFLTTLCDFSFNFPRAYFGIINNSLSSLGFNRVDRLEELEGEHAASFGIATMFKARNLLNIVKLNNIPQQELDACTIGQVENAQPFTSKDQILTIIKSFEKGGELVKLWDSMDSFAKLITTVLPPNVDASDDNFAALYKKSKYDSEDVKEIISWACGKSFIYNKARKKDKEKDENGNIVNLKQEEDYVILNNLLQKFMDLNLIKMVGTNNVKTVKFPTIKDKNQIDYARCNSIRNGLRNAKEPNKPSLMEIQFGRRFANAVMDLILNKYSKDVKDFNMIKKLINKDITDDDLKEDSSFFKFFNNQELIDDINALHVANVTEDLTLKNMSGIINSKTYRKYKLDDDTIKNIIDGTENADDINAQNEDIQAENDNDAVILRQNDDPEIKKLKEEEVKNFQELLSKYENHPLSQLDPTGLSIADVLWANNFIGQKSIVAKLTDVFGENGTAEEVVNKVKELLSQENGAEALKKYFVDEVKLSKSQAGALTNSFTKDIPNEPTEQQVEQEEVEQEQQEIQNEEVEEPEIIEEDVDEDEVDEEVEEPEIIEEQQEEQEQEQPNTNEYLSLIATTVENDVRDVKRNKITSLLDRHPDTTEEDVDGLFSKLGILLKIKFTSDAELYNDLHHNAFSSVIYERVVGEVLSGVDNFWLDKFGIEDVKNSIEFAVELLYEDLYERIDNGELPSEFSALGI